MSALKGAHLLEHPWTWKWKGLKVDSKENDGARPTQSGISSFLDLIIVPDI